MFSSLVQEDRDARGRNSTPSSPERLVRRRLGASRRSTAPTLHSTRRADACRKTNDSAELDTSRCSTVIQRRRKRFEAGQVEIIPTPLKTVRSFMHVLTYPYLSSLLKDSNMQEKRRKEQPSCRHDGVKPVVATHGRRIAVL